MPENTPEFALLEAPKQKSAVTGFSQDPLPSITIERGNIRLSFAELSEVPGASEHSEYFKHVLNEILIHQDEPVESYINNLLPWSDTLLDLCKSKNSFKAILVRGGD